MSICWANSRVGAMMMALMALAGCNPLLSSLITGNT